MADTASLTIRVDRALLRALKVRAAQNDRSANGELTSILRNILQTEKASDQPGSNSDASEQCP
ncbi:FitA-like ribbon-helix-helix domain-containing protein [Asaia krungthepensis]|uniref:FitA-like ribbon-helix-helix domain-containing protein n=1 Tax=Asaia krungthepensis TaxID=220990 RepID=UPI0035713796